MKKEFFNEIKERMETLNHEQVTYLLNIHGMYITNDIEKVPYIPDMTLEEWTLLRIVKTTYEKDYPTVFTLIDLINQGLRFDKLEDFCESMNYEVIIR